MCQWKAGDVLEIQYPIKNEVGEGPKAWQRRIVRVDYVRDLELEPLHPVSIETRPNVARSRYLLKCWDIVKAAFRQFYIAAASDAHCIAADGEVGLVRLAVFDPCEDDDPEFIGPVFRRSVPDDEFILRAAINRYNTMAAKCSDGLCVAAFPWAA